VEDAFVRNGTSVLASIRLICKRKKRAANETRGIAREQTTGTPFSFVRRGEIETANRVGVDEGEGREETGAQRKEATIGGDSVGRVRTRGKERKSGRTRGLCGRDSIKRTHINESFQSKTELYAGASISTRVRHACTYTCSRQQ